MNEATCQLLEPFEIEFQVKKLRDFIISFYHNYI